MAARIVNQEIKGMSARKGPLGIADANSLRGRHGGGGGKKEGGGKPHE